MMILLILVLLGLLLVAGFLAYWVIEERSDETWGPATPGRRWVPWAWGRRRPGHRAHT
jgi:hypothetical protein